LGFTQRGKAIQKNPALPMIEIMKKDPAIYTHSSFEIIKTGRKRIFEFIHRENYFPSGSCSGQKIFPGSE